MNHFSDRFCVSTDYEERSHFTEVFPVFRSVPPKDVIPPGNYRIVGDQLERLPDEPSDSFSKCG